jgi:hypothetical protein
MAAVPASLWHALAGTALSGNDAGKVGRSAYERGLYRTAEGFLRRGLAADEDAAGTDLAQLLARQHRVADLRDLVGQGNGPARVQLITLLSQQRNVDGLRRLSHDDVYARRELVDVLQRAGALSEAAEELRHLVAQGDEQAADDLVALLAELGETDELDRLAEEGSPAAKRLLAGLQADNGDLETARTTLIELAEAGDLSARWELACLLLDDGKLDSCVLHLRALTDQGHDDAHRQMVEILAENGQTEELYELARANDDAYAADALVRVLSYQDREVEASELLAKLMVTGHAGSRRRSAELLAKCGDLDGALRQLQTMATAGDESARTRLISLLDRHKKHDELAAMAAAGDLHAARRLAEIQVAGGNRAQALAQFTTLAAAGDAESRRRAAELAADCGDLDGAVAQFRTMTIAGDDEARRRLVTLLRRQGKPDEAARIVRCGFEPDGTTAERWFT